MRRLVVATAGFAIVLASLAGCGRSAYCEALDKNKVAVNALGEQQSNTAFLTYAKAFEAVAKVAPADIRPAWLTIAKTTRAVVTAQKRAGIPLEDMTNFKKLAKVPPEKQKLLNDAYAAFNDTKDGTHDERRAVIESAKDECEITLS